MKKNFLLLCAAIALFHCSMAQPGTNDMWSIGKNERLALAPNGYKQFIAHDFGFENKYFFVGHSVDGIDFPMYCLAPLIPGAAPGVLLAGEPTR